MINKKHMKLSFTNESNFDTLKLASFIQDVLTNEDFECNIEESTSVQDQSVHLELTLTLENKKLYLNESFKLSGGSSTRQTWDDQNGETFSCAKTFWRYIAANANLINA